MLERDNWEKRQMAPSSFLIKKCHRCKRPFFCNANNKICTMVKSKHCACAECCYPLSDKEQRLEMIGNSSCWKGVEKLYPELGKWRQEYEIEGS